MNFDDDFPDNIDDLKIITDTEDVIEDNENGVDLTKLSRGFLPEYDNKLFITRNGIYLDVTAVDIPSRRIMCNKFMIKTKASFGGGWNVAKGYNVIKRPIMHQNKQITQVMLLLPRFGFLDFYFKTLFADMNRIRKKEYASMTLLKKFKLCGVSNIVNQITSHSIIPNITSIDLVLAEHQTKIINYIKIHHYNNISKEFGYSGINLKVKTGAGKSYIAFGLIDFLKLPTLIVVHNQPQAEDMYQLTKKYFPNASVGIYHSTKKIMGDIMVIVIHSACGADNYTFGNVKLDIVGFFTKFSFIIFDESHKYCSTEFSKVFGRCQSTYMLGLSATPGERQDGFDELTYWNVGNTLDIVQKIPDILKDEPFTTKILGIKFHGSPEYTVHKISEHGMFDNNAMLIQMMEDPHRLSMIVPLLEYFAKNKRNVYIFSDRLEYLSIIRRALYSKIKNVDVLDEEIIEFMKTKPIYAEYVKNLQSTLTDKLSNESKKIQTHINIMAAEAYYNDVIKKYKVGELSGTWYETAFSAPDYKSYLTRLIPIANAKMKELQLYYTNILNEESTPEFYENLLHTYKINYIDQFIEEKTSFSILTGGASGQQINNSAENATMIFTTYGYMGTGKSIPKMDTILFVTPRRNGIEQVIGRVFRPGPNKNIRWIVDIIDWKINLKSQWYERVNVYERQGAQNRNPTISEIEITFNDTDSTFNKIKNTFEITLPKPSDCVIDFSKIDFLQPEKKPSTKTKIYRKF